MTGERRFARSLAAGALLLGLLACSAPVTVLAADAPAPVGPYAQAVRGGRAVYLSGQIGIDPATGALVEGGIRAEARRALRNLDAVLRAGGLQRDDVVRAEVYLVDIADYADLNAEYSEFFGAHTPARTCVAVAALPGGARVEIAFTAHARR